MIILSIDTSVKCTSIALSNNKELIKNKLIVSEQTHSETLMSEISSLLKECNTNINDIDLFACVIGPGSFTGIRVGVSLIKGLAFSTNKPCLGVSSLESLAENAAHLDNDYYVIPIIDARRNQLYNAVFKLKDHKLERICDDRIIMAETLVKELKSYDNIIFTGNGIPVINKFYDKPYYFENEFVNPNAFSIAKIAYDNYMKEKDKSIFNDIDLKPKYIRPSQAEQDYKG